MELSAQGGDSYSKDQGLIQSRSDTVPEEVSRPLPTPGVTALPTLDLKSTAWAALRLGFRRPAGVDHFQLTKIHRAHRTTSKLHHTRSPLFCATGLSLCL